MLVKSCLFNIYFQALNSVVLENIVSGDLKKNKKFNPEIKQFALTLQYYSSKAYMYVRKKFSNVLPHPRTLRRWYMVVDGLPGWTKEAFNALKEKNQLGLVCVNLVLDEMCIKRHVEMDNKRQIFGFVDMGIDGIYDHDDPPEAKNALVFIVVALNGYWKLPIGYFLIDSLNGKERANLLETAMSLLTEINIKIHSITFDGAHVNTAMCTHLGAKFTLNNPKTFIEYKDTKGKEQQMFIFYDPAHMLKLIRNTFQNKKVIQNKNGQLIKWEYLVKLVDVQTNQKLHAGNKLTYRHIHFFNEKMNVRLAAQTLSQSVCDSLKFMSTIDS